MTAPRIALGLLAGLALAATAAADNVRGVVDRVDPDKKEFVLDGRGHGLRGLPLLFTLGDDVRVLVGSEPGGLADLKPGVRVRVEFEDRGGRSVVVEVRVLGARAAAPAAPAEAGVVTGVLRRVSYSDREVVVVGPGPQGPETETTLTAPPDAVIRDGDKAIAFDDLKEGQSASVRVGQRDGKPVAAAIQVGPGVPAAAGRPRPLQRLRKLVHLADQILEQLDQADEGMRQLDRWRGLLPAKPEPPKPDPDDPKR
jgi:hypothetical protein